VNTPRITWPALRATLESHTVQPSTGGPRVAGFLVRCTSTRCELGYVWNAGSSWHWQMPEGAAHYGERSSQRAAVQVLREAHDLATTGCAQQSRLPLLNIDYVEDEMPSLLDSIDRAGRPTREREAAPVPSGGGRAATLFQTKPVPKPPTRNVVWDSTNTGTPDLTATVAAAFRKGH